MCCAAISNKTRKDTHMVVTAENGCETMEKSRVGHFDVVITDRIAPKMNGDQLASAIKEINPREPVIPLTAFTENSPHLRPEIDLQLSKPASLPLIRAALGKVVAI